MELINYDYNVKNKIDISLKNLVNSEEISSLNFSLANTEYSSINLSTNLSLLYKNNGLYIDDNNISGNNFSLNQLNVQTINTQTINSDTITSNVKSSSINTNTINSVNINSTNSNTQNIYTNSANFNSLKTTVCNTNTIVAPTFLSNNITLGDSNSNIYLYINDPSQINQNGSLQTTIISNKIYGKYFNLNIFDENEVVDIGNNSGFIINNSATSYILTNKDATLFLLKSPNDNNIYKILHLDQANNLTNVNILNTLNMSAMNGIVNDLNCTNTNTIDLINDTPIHITNLAAVNMNLNNFNAESISIFNSTNDLINSNNINCNNINCTNIDTNKLITNYNIHNIISNRNSVINTITVNSLLIGADIRTTDCTTISIDSDYLRGTILNTLATDANFMSVQNISTDNLMVSTITNIMNNNSTNVLSNNIVNNNLIHCTNKYIDNISTESLFVSNIETTSITINNNLNTNNIISTTTHTNFISSTNIELNNDNLNDIYNDNNLSNKYNILPNHQYLFTDNSLLIDNIYINELNSNTTATINTINTSTLKNLYSDFYNVQSNAVNSNIEYNLNYIIDSNIITDTLTCKNILSNNINIGSDNGNVNVNGTKVNMILYNILYTNKILTLDEDNSNGSNSGIIFKDNGYILTNINATKFIIKAPQEIQTENRYILTATDSNDLQLNNINIENLTIDEIEINNLICTNVKHDKLTAVSIITKDTVQMNTLESITNLFNNITTNTVYVSSPSFINTIFVTNYNNPPVTDNETISNINLNKLVKDYIYLFNNNVTCNNTIYTDSIIHAKNNIRDSLETNVDTITTGHITNISIDNSNTITSNNIIVLSNITTNTLHQLKNFNITSDQNITDKLNLDNISVFSADYIYGDYIRTVNLYGTIVGDVNKLDIIKNLICTNLTVTTNFMCNTLSGNIINTVNLTGNNVQSNTIDNTTILSNFVNSNNIYSNNITTTTFDIINITANGLINANNIDTDNIRVIDNITVINSIELDIVECNNITANNIATSTVYSTMVNSSDKIMANNITAYNIESNNNVMYELNTDTILTDYITVSNILDNNNNASDFYSNNVNISGTLKYNNVLTKLNKVVSNSIDTYNCNTINITSLTLTADDMYASNTNIESNEIINNTITMTNLFNSTNDIMHITSNTIYIDNINCNSITCDFIYSTTVNTINHNSNNIFTTNLNNFNNFTAMTFTINDIKSLELLSTVITTNTYFNENYNSGNCTVTNITTLTINNSNNIYIDTINTINKLTAYMVNSSETNTHTVASNLLSYDIFTNTIHNTTTSGINLLSNNEIKSKNLTIKENYFNTEYFNYDEIETNSIVVDTLTAYSILVENIENDKILNEQMTVSKINANKVETDILHTIESIEISSLTILNNIIQNLQIYNTVEDAYLNLTYWNVFRILNDDNIYLRIHKTAPSLLIDNKVVTTMTLLKNEDLYSYNISIINTPNGYDIQLPLVSPSALKYSTDGTNYFEFNGIVSNIDINSIMFDMYDVFYNNTKYTIDVIINTPYNKYLVITKSTTYKYNFLSETYKDNTNTVLTTPFTYSDTYFNSNIYWSYSQYRYYPNRTIFPPIKSFPDNSWYFYNLGSRPDVRQSISLNKFNNSINWTYILKCKKINTAYDNDINLHIDTSDYYSNQNSGWYGVNESTDVHAGQDDMASFANSGILNISFHRAEIHIQKNTRIISMSVVHSGNIISITGTRYTLSAGDISSLTNGYFLFLSRNDNIITYSIYTKTLADLLVSFEITLGPTGGVVKNNMPFHIYQQENVKYYEGFIYYNSYISTMSYSNVILEFPEQDNFEDLYYAPFELDDTVLTESNFSVIQYNLEDTNYFNTLTTEFNTNNRISLGISSNSSNRQLLLLKKNLLNMIDSSIYNVSFKISKGLTNLFIYLGVNGLNYNDWKFDNTVNITSSKYAYRIAISETGAILVNTGIAVSNPSSNLTNSGGNSYTINNSTTNHYDKFIVNIHKTPTMYTINIHTYTTNNSIYFSLNCTNNNDDIPIMFDNKLTNTNISFYDGVVYSNKIQNNSTTILNKFPVNSSF